MDNIEHEFEAKTNPLKYVFEHGRGHTGFKIPVYQRDYNWAETHIRRLLEDIIENINNLIPENEKDQSDVHSYTFLGTMIVTKDVHHESDFEENSYLVIDGQQRLTTLSLLACMLLERLYISEANMFDGTINPLKSSQIELIKKHFSKVRESLFSFCLGKISSSGNDVYFPKIIRSDIEDHRAKESGESEYKSDIADLLNKFENYFRKNKKNISSHKFDFDTIVPKGRINQNLTSIRGFIDDLSKNKYESEEGESFSILEKNDEKFNHRNIKSILSTEKLKPEWEGIIQKRNNDCDPFYKNHFFPFLRISFFAQYLVNNVIMTVVQCPNEHYALSIFEKTNTAGEPLTALETFKSEIMTLENNKNLDKGKISDIKHIFNDKVEKYVTEYSDDKSSEKSLERRKKVSTDIVFAFSQSNNKQASTRLASQRRVMKGFSKIENIDDKLKFVERLNDICIYRKKFWDNRKEINESDLTDPIARVCLLYLRAMNKTLTIPLLSNIFANYHHSSVGDFENHVKSITAFTLLWRAYTGTTGGIEGKYRSFIGEFSKKSYDLKATSEILREALLIKINPEKETELKNKWIENVTKNDLYGSGNKNTAKFFLLHAGDKTNEKINRPDNRVTKFLHDSIWSDKLYETIDHIAPQKPKEDDKDGLKIRTSDLTNTIGNLSLLPKGANSSASNIPWEEKKKLYIALSKGRKEEVKEYCEKNLDGKFPKTLDNIEKYPILPMLESFAEKETWDPCEVRKRSKEILELAWDLYSWI